MINGDMVNETNVNDYAKELIKKYPALKKHEDFSNVVYSVIGERMFCMVNVPQQRLITFYSKDKKLRTSYIIHDDKVEELK